MAADEGLERLQELLLSAVLGGQVLPGAAAPLRLPDLDLVLGGPAILLADDNLAGSLDPSGLPRPLRIVGEKELREEAAARDSVAYLRFQPAERRGDTTWLTIEVRLAARRDAAQPAVLGGVRTGFRIEGGAWRVIDGPIAFAT